MTGPGNQVIATYSALAEKYDDPGHLKSCWTAHSDRIVASLSLKSGFQTVAEVGCGTGRALLHLAGRSDPALRFIGVEPAEELRRRAPAATHGLPHARMLDVASS